MADFFDRLLARSAPGLRADGAAETADGARGVTARPRQPHPYERPTVSGGLVWDETEVRPDSAGAHQGPDTGPQREWVVRERTGREPAAGSTESAVQRLGARSASGPEIGIRALTSRPPVSPVGEERARWNPPLLQAATPPRWPERAIPSAPDVLAEGRPGPRSAVDGGLLTAGSPSRPAEAPRGIIQAGPPQRAAAPAPRPAARTQQPVVNIRIGRLEVRAAAQQAPGVAPRPGRPGRDPALSLEKYLAGEGRRR